MPSTLSTLGRRQDVAKDLGRTATRPRNARRDRRRGGIHRRDLRSGEKRGDLVGRCRAGNATKVMAIADRNGLPLALYLASGNRYDSVLTERTLDAAFVAKLPPRLIGDRAWDAGVLQQRLWDERKIDLIAPKRGGQRPSRRKQDGRKLRRYKRRWRVEWLFSQLKRFRRLATRWELKAANFFGFLQLASCVLILRALHGRTRL
ncbi:MAG TPA: IS5 family transposase [Kofleriaceae bacterium]